MLEKGVQKPRDNSGFVVQLNLAGLIIFSLALVAAAGLVTYGLVSPRLRAATFESSGTLASAPGADPSSSTVSGRGSPPWGELVTSDIDLEQPAEYAGFELDSSQEPAWVFGGMNAEQVRALLISCEIPLSRVDHALSPNLASATASGTVVHPDEDLVLSLSPESRARLYAELAKDPENHWMTSPACFPGRSFDTRFAGANVDPAIVSLTRKLLYPRGDIQCFSDYATVARHVASEQQRLDWVEVLSCQTAVLASLRIRPDTDADKLLGYWERGIQVKDVRPLIESLKRLPDGGFINLLHFLPPFARDRLYTSPLPTRPGDPSLDCHWSTLNFFNDTPDDRLADPKYASAYLGSHYYPIAKPSLYGDVIFVLDDRGNAIHSGVYIADDLIFTKNGGNYAEPWKLMRMKDLATLYGLGTQPRIEAYRNKNW
jgi:hypothetical protein